MEQLEGPSSKSSPSKTLVPLWSFFKAFNFFSPHARKERLQSNDRDASSASTDVSDVSDGCTRSTAGSDERRAVVSDSSERPDCSDNGSDEEATNSGHETSSSSASSSLQLSSQKGALGKQTVSLISALECGAETSPHTASKNVCPDVSHVSKRDAAAVLRWDDKLGRWVPDTIVITEAPPLRKLSIQLSFETGVAATPLRSAAAPFKPENEHADARIFCPSASAVVAPPPGLAGDALAWLEASSGDLAEEGGGQGGGAGGPMSPLSDTQRTPLGGTQPIPLVTTHRTSLRSLSGRSTAFVPRASRTTVCLADLIED